MNLFSQNRKKKEWTEVDINNYYDRLNDVEKKNKIDTNLKFLRSKRKFNGVVLISYRGKILVHKSYGYSDLRKKRALSINSVFELASVSKQFTATAIMLLKERGKLYYSDSVQKFIPQFPYNGVTIHHLLSHRSGLPHYYNFAPNYWNNVDEDLTNQDLIKMMIEHKPQKRFEPDKKYEYCNTGYCVLAYIVETITGEKLGDFLEKEIFLKVGMNNTFVHTNYKSKFKNQLTKGHNGYGVSRNHTFLSGTTGDKGVYSTANDLFLWNMALIENKILKKETLQEAILPKSVDREPWTNYGYGYHLGTVYWGQPLVYHGGLWNGYNNIFIRRINDDSFIVVLSNVANFSFRGQSYNWLEIMDGL